MLIQVRLPYLDLLGNVSYSTEGDIPVFLNGDLLNPIGNCEVDYNDDDEMLGDLFLDSDVNGDLFLYYLGDVSIADHFRFAGLDLREKRLRRVPWKESKVIAMPRLEVAKEKRTKRLRDVVIWGLEGELEDED